MNVKSYAAVWMLINRAADLSRAYLFAASGMSFENLTSSQQSVMGVIYSYADSGVMLKQIAAEVSLTPGAVSQIVESLVRLDVVERTHSTEDRRAVCIRPSPKGREFFESTLRQINPILHEVLNQNIRDGKTFVKVLEKLVERFANAGTPEKSQKAKNHKST